MNPLSDAAPSASGSDRLEILDALRGFALLGVLLANIQGLGGWLALSDEQRIALVGQSQFGIWTFLEVAFVDGKFYSLFSLMFGVGFSVILARLGLRQPEQALSIFRRRLWVLAGIGLVHLWLIWRGDILLLYALLGFGLVALRQLSDRKLLVTAACLIALPILGYGLCLAFDVQLNRPVRELAVHMDKAVNGANASLPTIEKIRLEGLAAFLQTNLPGPLFRLAYLIQSWRIPKVLGLFLLGLWVGRRLVAGQLLADRALLKRVLWMGLTVGIPGNALMALMEINGDPQRGLHLQGWLFTITYALSVVPLALAYAAGFVLSWQAGAGRGLELFTPIGRMALTNYLCQSIVCITLFYGVGFGLAGTMGPSRLLVIALSLFAVQWWFSRWWLNRFAFGPAEWLWRSLTYRRRLPMLRPVAA